MTEVRYDYEILHGVLIIVSLKFATLLRNILKVQFRILGTFATFRRAVITYPIRRNPFIKCWWQLLITIYISDLAIQVDIYENSFNIIWSYKTQFSNNPKKVKTFHHVTHACVCVWEYAVCVSSTCKNGLSNNWTKMKYSFWHSHGFI